MQVTLLGKERPAWVAALAVLALTLLGYAHFLLMLNRELIFIGAIAMIWMFARGDIRRLWNLPTVLLLGYAGFTAISGCWATAGKFFLYQFAKLVPATVIFFALVLYGRAEKGLVRRVMAAIASISALVALLSVEASSTKLVKYITYELLDREIQMSFAGSRLYGVFGNSNIESALYAIGVFFALALALDTKDKRLRAFYAVLLAMNAFAFLLVFSMGAMVCFAIATVVYLIAAGKGRGEALVLMLCAALPATLLAFAATRAFRAEGVLAALPLVLMLLGAAATAALDRLLSERLGATFAAHEKMLYGVILGIVALGVLYLALAMRLSAPYTFGGGLSRAVELAPGEHTLALDASGTVSTTVVSKTSVQVLTDTKDTLYSGSDAQLRFTVPEGSVTVWFYLSGDAGTTLRSAVIDGETPVMLRYRLLPDFAANRLQGSLKSNASVLVRLMLWRDGLRYWRLSPIVGKGMGSFESGIVRVQDFDYETKFPHNHYVQVLLEDGVIGFALFLGAHVALGAALWRRRRALREGPYAVLSAAFFAEFVMNLLHMMWDIQLTNVVFLCQLFAFYAVVVLLCAEPLGKKQPALPDAAEAETAADTPEAADVKTAKAADAKAAKAGKNAKAPKTAKKGKGASAKPAVRQETRAACMLIPVFLAVTFLGNIIAHPLIVNAPDTLPQFLKNLELASKIDLYEHNDARLTYALQVAQYKGTEQYRPQADAYAAQLGKLESNSIQAFLIEYYVNTQQYEKAVDMALVSTVYAASDVSEWNTIINGLRQVFFDTGLGSPLMNPAVERVVTPKLVQYYDAWRARNEVALLPVTLDPENERFFDAVRALDACNGNATAIAMVLSAHGK